ncbi:MAG TPA: Ig-like domain-containing protein, partial [Gemmatimonadaceae bacterium]
MQKVSRSIFAGLLVIAGLTACGDKVTVAPGNGNTSTAGTPVVHSVTVTPASVSLGVGQTVQLVASVDADATLARTVTWASTAPAKATVSSSGLVTAVASGTVAITATSTADATVVGAATIIVAQTTAATISIGSIDKGGLPANLSGVTGQLDVTLNVDQGTQTVTELDLIVHNNTTNTDTTVAKYSFSSSSKVPASGSPSATSAPITMSFNTAAYNATTGAVAFINGSYSIKAQAVVAGSATQAPVSSTISYAVTNVDFMTVSAKGDTVATDASGRQWTAGAIHVTVTPVLYSGKGLLSATVSPAPAATAAAQTLTTFPGTVSFAVGKDTITDSSYVAFATAKYSDATQFNGGVAVNANTLRVDNKAPTKASVFALGADSTPANSLLVPWVNGTYVFSKGLAKVVDSSTVAGTGLGVGGVTTTFYAIPNDVNWVGLGAAGAVGSASGTTKCALPSNAIAAASGATITVQSGPGDTTTYRGRAVSTDKLGNVVCQDLTYANSAANNVQEFGVDNTVPVNAAIGVTGAKNGNAGLTAAAVGTNWVWVLQDSISGFSAKPILATSVWNYHTAAAGGCIVGTVVSGACTAVAIHQTFAVDSGKSGQNGYFTMSSTISDVAGNTVVIPAATVLIDNVAPAAGTIGTVPTGVGDSAVTYTGGVTDNVDLVSSAGGISYPSGYSISYPTTINPQHAAFSGTRDTTGTVTLTVGSHFISSLAVTSGVNAPQGTPLGAGTHPTDVLLGGIDGVGNIGGDDIAGPAVTDGATAQVWDNTMFATFAENNAVSTGTGATLTAQVTGATAALNVPFSMVCWYSKNATTNFYDLVGCQNLAVATQTSPTTNTWDWTGPAVAR